MSRTVFAVVCFVVWAIAVPSAHAAPALDAEASAMLASANKSLHDGRPGDAIDSFEALADRGVVDPVASYDRGLAYATRVRIGAEHPGDLGRAAQGFEEARALTHDAHLADDASRALTVVRSEIARRRLRAGQPADVEAGRSMARTLAGIVSESAWAVACTLASALLGAGLFARWLGRGKHFRVAGGVAAGVAAPALALSVAMTVAARRDRLELHEAVVVSPDARPVDERGLTLPSATPLPEGALVEVIDERGPSVRVRFGTNDEWLVAGDVRPIAVR